MIYRVVVVVAAAAAAVVVRHDIFALVTELV
jgi:hypothetical protein